MCDKLGLSASDPCHAQEVGEVPLGTREAAGLTDLSLGYFCSPRP